MLFFGFLLILPSGGAFRSEKYEEEERADAKSLGPKTRLGRLAEREQTKSIRLPSSDFFRKPKFGVFLTHGKGLGGLSLFLTPHWDAAKE